MTGRNRLKLAALVVGRLIVGTHTQVNRGSLAFADRHHGRCPYTNNKGFGSHLLERAFEGGIGSAHLDYDPQGLVCVLEIATI
jgi:two-component sensor histidine kinase